MLTPEQISAIRDLMTRCREDEGMGPRPNWRALVDGMDVMLGTSARVAKCIGLRRCDVDMTSAPPTILIGGTIVQNKKQGITRHIYRRTVATLIERSAGLTIAPRLLGYANEMVTRSSYVVTAEQVDIVTTDILDTVLGV